MSGVMSAGYSQIAENTARLKGLHGELTTNQEQLRQLVGEFSDYWTGQAATTFQEDYTTLLSAFNSASDTLSEITELVTKYAAQVQEIEQSFGGSSHVTIS